ncbi:hypothetical protein HDU83_007170 [Entophlyctis luteolus]|nr:hypothetical protein HDU82_000678 [Entophlyctis luteolus]KAJ3340281.1 hypothetical protein HDU83_007170 [Entophlyctis luteolus]KAJ3383918.1 hypothetical protein HDU84_003277 [Entophlyctis sp. JEL0112]
MFHTVQTSRGPVLVRVTSEGDVTALHNMKLWRGHGRLDGSVGLVAVLPSSSNASLTLRPKGSKHGMVTLERNEAIDAPADRIVLCAWIAELHAELDHHLQAVPPHSPTTRSAVPPALRQASTPSSKRSAPRSLLNPRMKIRESKKASFVSDEEGDSDK